MRDVGRARVSSDIRTECYDSEVARKAAGSTVVRGLDSLYLSSHLRPPLYRIGLVARPRLTGFLDTATVDRVVLVHAPAGFGKTTLLYQWSERLRAGAVTVCWLSAAREDSDSYRFVYHMQCSVWTALDEVHSFESLRSVPMEKANPTADVEALVRNLTVPGRRSVLIIDDYHLAESEANNRILNEVVNAVNDRVTVVVSSRTKPAMALSYFKCQGWLASIDASALKFTGDECKELFADSDPGAARAVHRRCAGWPMALQLAKLWLREADIRVDPSFEVDANATGIADYLTGEVFRQLKPEVARMMVETSILDQVQGDLANHITGRSDCWSLIDEVDTLDGLVLPSATQDGWFRYHQLFREFLQGQLAHYGTERLAKLHSRASDWFEGRGDIEQSAFHAAQTSDVDRVIRIIESAGAVRIGLTAGMPALRQGLRHLSGTDIYARPRLHLAQIWLLAKQGEVAAAREQYDQCAAALAEAPTSKQAYSDVEKESLFVGMMLAEVYEDRDFDEAEIRRIETMARDVSIIDHWFQGWVNNLLCIMHTRKGNLHNAMAVTQAAMFHYRQVGSHYGEAWMMLHLALIGLIDGRLNEADRSIIEAEEQSRREFEKDPGLMGVIRVVNSVIRMERNEIGAATSDLFDALTVVERTEGWVEVFVQGCRAAVGLAYVNDGFDFAMQEVARARRMAGDRKLPRLDDAATLFEIEILTLDGKLDEAERLTGVLGEAMNEPKLGDDGWRERVQCAVVGARLAIYQGQSEATLVPLRRYVVESERFDRRRAVVELAAILALAEHAAGNRDNCVAALRKALHTAVEEKLRHIFVKEGRPMARMLEVMIRHIGVSSMGRETVTFLSELVAALRQTSSGSEDSAGILTAKEIAVLAQSADGNPNKVIARNLDISVATVKFHLANVYRKLGVGSRSMAVAVARKHDLL